MAQRRMFSLKIVGSDAFLEMPTSSRELYFQLGMYADDDGFISPRKIMRMIGASDDDLKMLIAKRFVLPFESGIVVVKHWKMNNQLRSDRHSPTQYIKELSTLIENENGAYTELNKADIPDWQPNGNQMVPQVRLGKVRLNNTSRVSDESQQVLEHYNQTYGTKFTSAMSIQDNLDYWLKQYTLQDILSAIDRIKDHDYWAGKMTPVILLRRKTPGGEHTDHIGSLLNYQKNTTKVLRKENYEDTDY